MKTSSRATSNVLSFNGKSKEFKECFELLARKHSAPKVFGDFLDFTIYALTLKQFKEDYVKIEKYYKQEELGLFLQMLQLMGDAMDDKRDVLGDIFMECVSFGHNGQFFTPNEVGDLMSDLVSVKDLKDGQSICDPACGSGRLLLRAARQIQSQKIKAFYYGADLDLLCVKMTAINMFLNRMPGEVAWMNTLTMEHFRSYFISIGWFGFPILEIKGKDQTSFVVRLENTINSNQIYPNSGNMPKQLSLDI